MTNFKDTLITDQTYQYISKHFFYSTDWPLSVSFIGPGNTSSTADVIENTTNVNRSCTADCNPHCNYIWINNTDGSIILHTAFLDLIKPDRYDSGSYICQASNRYGEKNKTFTLYIRCKFSGSLELANC